MSACLVSLWTGTVQSREPLLRPLALLSNAVASAFSELFAKRNQVQHVRARSLKP